jgi:glucose/arabinose dehydrogenase
MVLNLVDGLPVDPLTLGLRMFTPMPMEKILAPLVLLALAGNAQAAREDVQLPAPDPEHRVRHFPRVIGWSDGAMPRAPAGFSVSKYADGLRNPRWIHVTPNGDVLVAEAATDLGRSANRITLFRDSDGDGKPELRVTFLENLKQPLGMQVVGDWFYVANTDALWRYRYQTGDRKIHAEGEKILDLPAGGYNNHWTRNLLANADNSKLYVSVGSGSNLGEHGMANEVRRANILEINPDGSGERIYAAGLRNPVGMAWAPGTQALWSVVNERDNLGDDLVPDYLTRVKEGGFYGWPYAYFGAHEDPRMAGERPDLVARTLMPDVALDAHSASLGLAFYNQTAFPPKYRGGAFIGQHGSWNRRELAGYKVAFVPFRDGEPSGPVEDFLTGFIADSAKGEVRGRPVGVAVLADGSLLVADDSGNTLWRVRADG